MQHTQPTINGRNYINAPGATDLIWEVDVKIIFQIVTAVYGVGSTLIKSRNRSDTVVEARQVFCYLMRRHAPKQSLTGIGQYINRCHATIIHSIKAVYSLMDAYKAYRNKVGLADALVLRTRNYTSDAYSIKEFGFCTLEKQAEIIAAL